MLPTLALRSAGSKIPYPKHVWSPAGGWYAQPANWKGNTSIMGGVIVGICLMVGSVSADREHRTRMPEAHRFFPSRYWSREIVEYERAQQGSASREGGGSGGGSSPDF
ncbi:hypothetical protein B0A55_10614 [Friedmanniomyces simplex]|uniref:Uncharacterized protein n=1 Tax=Friedmanniomyces simplex TaxID=329884 RepID=A0A4U0WLL8_9PEZI|nr:hypothetical protein B0A55_10614 [Friedmanniomyces simplex]